MPDRKNHNLPGKDVVANVIANAIKLEAAQFRILSGSAALPDARLKSEQSSSSLKVLRDHPGRGGSVYRPPLCCTFELSKRARRDFDGKHSPSVGAELAQDFRDGNRFATE